ncbi:transcription factor, MADS-box, partial [Tanacetum coccineum]
SYCWNDKNPVGFGHVQGDDLDRFQSSNTKVVSLVNLLDEAKTRCKVLLAGDRRHLRHQFESMGRVKVSMELINDSKKRKITFLRRKEGLIKKARELSTLCDVNVKTDSDPRKIKPYSLCDFFKDRKNKIEGELAKAKKSNLEAKYPTSFEFLDNSSEVQLRDFACELGMKLNQVMPLLKHNPITTMTHFDYNNNDNTSIMSNSHVESSGSSISNVDNGFYPIMLMGQNVFGIDQRLMQALNPNSMKSEVINDCYDRPNFDLKREMMHQLEQPQYRNMHQFMPSCFY